MYTNDLIFREVPTLKTEEGELELDDGLTSATGEGEEPDDVFSWDQLLNEDSLDVDER